MSALQIKTIPIIENVTGHLFTLPADLYEKGQQNLIDHDEIFNDPNAIHDFLKGVNPNFKKTITWQQVFDKVETGLTMLQEDTIFIYDANKGIKHDPIFIQLPTNKLVIVIDGKFTIQDLIK